MKEINFTDNISEERDVMISEFKIDGKLYRAISHFFYKDSNNKKCSGPKLFTIDIYSIMSNNEEENVNELRKVYHFTYDSDLSNVLGNERINPVDYFQDIEKYSFSIRKWTHNSIYKFANEKLSFNKGNKKSVCIIHVNNSMYGSNIETYVGELYVDFDSKKHNGIVVMPNGLQVDIRVEPDDLTNKESVIYNSYNGNIYFISDSREKVCNDAIHYLEDKKRWNQKEIAALEYKNRDLTENIDNLIKLK